MEIIKSLMIVTNSTKLQCEMAFFITRPAPGSFCKKEVSR